MLGVCSVCSVCISSGCLGTYRAPVSGVNCLSRNVVPVSPPLENADGLERPRTFTPRILLNIVLVLYTGRLYLVDLPERTCSTSVSSATLLEPETSKRPLTMHQKKIAKH
jgi:hypothetical protein